MGESSQSASTSPGPGSSCSRRWQRGIWRPSLWA